MNPAKEGVQFSISSVWKWAADHWTILTAIALLFATVVSFIGHLCFWGSFDVDFTRYMDISEFIRRALPAFATGVLYMLALLATDHVRISISSIIKQNKVGVVLLILYLAGAFILPLSKLNNGVLILTRVLGIGLACFLIVKTQHSNYFVSRERIAEYKHSLLYASVVGPFFVAGLSLSSATNIRIGLDCNEVKSIEFDAPVSSSKYLGLKYIGTIGDKIFLCGKVPHKVTILSYEHIVSITYGERRRDAK